MQVTKDQQQISLLISIPWELDAIRVIGKPNFLKVHEILQGSGRYLEILCEDTAYFPAFELFCDLVIKNVQDKHLPALSVFLNALRTWDWQESKKIA
ncbi:hypothetical protein [Leptospira sp. GIMC2001]|uniref:hypothetical protein n=1 Tax=Leptospira sp. GIMC2001 TaxID=1513297 RepID=UPI00234A8175|nr:hypothetical protein [Leptospira sp. GIMC2001]WCL50366.1 hypothetical protein O4O04_05985 [Leptospira sp. GIMC2001]